MQAGVTPELLDFILRLSQFLLIAFAIMIGGAAVVYVKLFWKGNFDGESIAKSCSKPTFPSLRRSS